MSKPMLLVLLAACAPKPAAVEPVPAARATELSPLELRTLDGARWSSRDALGKVLVVDVWATYCKPCRAAFPKLNRVAAAHPDAVVVGVSIDDDDAVVRSYLAEVPAEFTIARDSRQSIQTGPLAVAKLPTLLVVDRKGRVRFRGDTEAAERGYDALPALVTTLLAEPP